MNQHQRKFLLEEIEKQYRREKDTLQKKKPIAPNLDNYLIAEILDGSAVMRPIEKVQESIRQRVRDLGKGEALVTTASRSVWGGRRRESEEDEDVISLPALLLFEMPKAFVEVRDAYEEAIALWNQQMTELESSINAMRIKVQVGSDDALESLVAQADKLCSMSLTSSSRLLLPAPAK